MECKRCKKESLYIDDDTFLCADCIDREFLDWIESKYPDDD